jgi:hypothetical protein
MSSDDEDWTAKPRRGKNLSHLSSSYGTRLHPSGTRPLVLEGEESDPDDHDEQSAGRQGKARQPIFTQKRKRVVEEVLGELD